LLDESKIKYQFINKTEGRPKLISSIARSSNVSLIVLDAKGFELKRNLKNIASLIVELTSCTMLLVP
tara:strand:- start:747 stop:947 length:201 start_codon:yes stop_codon:yes gene_type:complete